MKGNVILPKGPEETDKKYPFCRRHRLNLENPKEPTERDKKLIDTIRYVIKKLPQPDGTIRVVGECPRCLSTVEIDIIKRPLLAE